MKLYFDTAYLAKCCLNEPDGKAVRQQCTSVAEIWSNDRRLLAAAEHFGLRGRSV